MAKKLKAEQLLLETKNNDLFASMEEKFGKGTIVRASDKKSEEVKEWISSGSLTLDLACGGIGKTIPKGGRCTCLLGKEGSGKTTLALHIIAEEHKKKNPCCFLDVENSIDLDYAETIGVNLDLLYLVDRGSLLKHFGVKDREIISGEEWLEFLCEVLKSDIYPVVVMDSIAALIPMAEIVQGIQGGRLAGVASMMAKGYRAVNAALTTYSGAFIYLNQYRMNPGGYIPLVEPGGEAWKYLQSLKIEIYKKVDKEKTKEETIAHGIIVKGKVTKSKVCIPFREFEYYLKFGQGIVRESEILDLAVKLDMIKKGGAGWYTYEDNKLQGEDNFIKLLQDNPEMSKEIEDKIMENINKE
jgi:recombination protein RecA